MRLGHGLKPNFPDSQGYIFVSLERRAAVPQCLGCPGELMHAQSAVLLLSASFCITYMLKTLGAPGNPNSTSLSLYPLLAIPASLCMPALHQMLG